MQHPRSESIIDYLWGDKGFWARASRALIKMLFAALCALGAHEALAWHAFSFDSGKLNSIASVANRSVAGLKSELHLDAKNANGERSLNYGFSAHGKESATPHYLIRVSRFGPISFPHFEDSIDVMVRQLERAEVVAASGQQVSAASTKLCYGTVQVLDKSYCDKAERFRKQLARGDSVCGLISDVRLYVLLLGPIQWLTLSVFIFACIETVGLWLRWVIPANAWEEGSASAKNAELGVAFDKVIDKRVNGVVDEFLLKVIRLTRETKKRVTARHRDMQDSDYAELRDATRTVLRNYRDQLRDEAGTRQEFLDVLGDTMLKVAFMGTVYGISVSLFAARELDAADPIIRISAKSHMYAGIGMGFGATLVGIVLSIAASKLRAALSLAWESEIGKAYQVVSRLNDGGLYMELPTAIDHMTSSEEPDLQEGPVGQFLRFIGMRAIAVVLIVIALWLIYRGIKLVGGW